MLKTRIREIAFLTKGIRITLKDLRLEEPVEKVFHYEGGIKEFVQYLNKSKTPLYEDIMYFEGTVNGLMVEVAMQHNDPCTKCGNHRLDFGICINFVQTCFLNI